MHFSDPLTKPKLANPKNVITFPVRKSSASVAQLVEQKTLNLFVEGSNPSGGTNKNKGLQGFLISHPFLLEAKWPALTQWMGGAATEKNSSACRFQIDL